MTEEEDEIFENKGEFIQRRATAEREQKPFYRAGDGAGGYSGRGLVSWLRKNGEGSGINN